MIETLLPHVQKLVSEKTMKTLTKEGPKTVAKGIYTLLPGAIRLIVKEESFINFYLTHQDKIFGKQVPVKRPGKSVTAKMPDTKRKK